MGWIFDHLGLVVFFAVLFSAYRKVKALMAEAGEPSRPVLPARPIANLDPEEAKRVREIQEQIRRKIAARRGGVSASLAPAAPAAAGPRPAVPTLDPFGGPGRGRLLDEMRRRAQPAAPPVLVPAPAQLDRAVLERQQQLSDQMRQLEEARVLAQRRASQAVATEKAAAESETGLLTASRGGLLEDLRDARTLRQAFVLREVLGPPVGLR